MNLIGHNYIAYKVIGRYNALIAAGCHLPDLVPFVANSIFSFDEIHESPDLLFNFLQKNNPEQKDLALGLMAHSVKFGADSFNREIDIWLLEKNGKLKEEIAKRISLAANVSFEVAAGPRIHNYLWCGLDFYIQKKYPDFVRQLKSLYQEAPVAEIAGALSTAFNKPHKLTAMEVAGHLSLINKFDVATPQGFMKFWKVFTKNLPEKDRLDVRLGVQTASFIEKMFSDRWEGVIEKVKVSVTKRMKSYLPKQPGV